MPVSRAEILQLIPHAGSMCLHDGVLEFDARRIVCHSEQHRESTHPLRRGQQLSALHLAEYGAQAMAIHGGLLARQRGEPAAPGFLASVRDFQLQVQRLDEIVEPIHTEATVLLAAATGWTYNFRCTTSAQQLASGRVMVMLNPMDRGTTT